MARYMFIVSRQRQALCDYLRARFSEDPKADVILDRRQVARRQLQIVVESDRRQSDRRQRSDLEELRLRSLAIVEPP